MLRNPILIAGPPRSGTSMLAGLLAHHGVWVGDTIPADEGNQKGYYENIAIVEVTKLLLKKNGYRPKTVPPFPAKLEDIGLKQKLSSIVPHNTRWLYKDSKLLLMYPLWRTVFKSALWVLPERGVMKIVDSMLRHPVWKRRASRHDKDWLYGIVNACRQRQEEIARNEKHIWTDSHLVITHEHEAEAFVRECDLEFDHDTWNEWVDRTLWNG